ncbi:MAG: response regulator [Vicingaceae bacterium]|nr:response regulator [Vicingaceae bacterium]
MIINNNKYDSLRIKKLNSMNKPVILCVDDEKIVLDSLKSQLKANFGNSCHIEIAQSGYEAMEIINDMYENLSTTPSVVICDQIMPNMKGDRLLAQIKGFLPKTICILLTGQADFKDVISAVNNAGLYRYINKPWNVQDLNLTVEQALIAYQKDLELEVSNHQLKDLNKNLEKTIQERTAVVIKQKEELEKKNNEINQSLIYAKRIQDALLPIKLNIEKSLPEHFIIFKPLDMVSGDFYWFKKIDNLIFTAVVDCTGHGIPGALMSILGFELLFNVIESKGIHEPSEILSEMHKSMVKALKQKSSGVQDGMDMAICCINTSNKTIKFSGAKNHLLFINNGKLNIIKGNALPIGGMIDLERDYKQHVISYDEDMTFYLSSDGYYDQFGGPNSKKMLRKSFMNLIKINHSKSLEKQRELLIEKLALWQGKEDQVDDITIFGFKIPNQNIG